MVGLLPKALSRIANLFPVFLSVVIGTGCLPPLHKPPKPGKPSATLKFRINHYYSSPMANQFLARILIDRRRWPFQAVRRGASSTWTRVKPGWRTVAASTYLAYRYSVTVTYNENYSESYRCGTTTCYRNKTRTRYRTEYRSRTLGSCKRWVQAYFRNGGHYIIYYNYVGPFSCNVSCHQQSFLPGRGFRMVPCRVARAGR